MTTHEELSHRKQSLLELANVSAVCQVMGVSRQHFYDIKQAYEEGGVEALLEKSGRGPKLATRCYAAFSP
jgi:transposase